MAVVNPPAYIQASSHPSDVFRRALKALAETTAGVVGAGDCAVTQNGTPNMSVNVAAGLAVLLGTENATSQGAYVDLNDATVNLAISAADPTNPRNDLVCFKVQDAQYSGATNAGSLVVVQGAPAGTPADPATPANAIVLARVRVNAGVTSITNATITDLRPFLYNSSNPVGTLGITGATAASRYVGATTGGAPASGSFLKGDFALDQLGMLWICTAAGSPGTWVAASPSARFHAEVWLNVATNLANNAFTTIPFDQVEADPNANFTTGAAAKYTCPVNGRYRVSFAVSAAFAAAVTNFIGAIYKNAAELKRTFQGTFPVGAGNIATGSHPVRCNATDTLQVLCYQNTGGAIALNLGQVFTHAQFEYLGPL